MLYGEGFIVPGQPIRVTGKRAREGSYSGAVGKPATVYAPSRNHPDRVRIKINGEEGTWWVYCDDIEPTIADNESMLKNLKEVPRDERPLPRII